MKRIRIFRYIGILILSFISAGALTACSDKDVPPPHEMAENTLFVYFPYTYNLSAELTNNLKDLKTAFIESAPDNQRVVVYFATSRSSARLFEIKKYQHVCIEEDLMTFSDPVTPDADHLKKLLSTVKAKVPAKHFSMAIGSHGTGWTPKQSTTDADYGAFPTAEKKMYWDSTPSGGPLTRFFGGIYAEDMTDISDLVQALKDTDIHMRYIMFDACYMANIEVAWALREVTDCLIASTCEIMGIGMPYSTIGQYIFGTPDYPKIVETYYNFYTNYSYPYGTLAAVDCTKLQALADAMYNINAKYSLPQAKLSLIQALDGYNSVTKHIFYDFHDYVKVLTDGNTEDLKTIEDALDNIIISKANTPEFYTNYFPAGARQIRTFSGVTISDPTLSSPESTQVKSTEWYKATHP